MKIRHTTSSGKDKIELNMTSMIDIVFQLLVFFIMSLRIVAQEGDFNVKMPLASSGPPTSLDVPQTIIVRLSAANNGQLDSISVNGKSIGTSFDALNNQIIDAVGSAAPGDEDNSEVELGFDRNLHYYYVVQAMTSISGYVEDGKVVKLIEKIKFSSPEKKPGE